MSMLNNIHPLANVGIHTIPREFYIKCGLICPFHSDSLYVNYSNYYYIIEAAQE